MNPTRRDALVTIAALATTASAEAQQTTFLTGPEYEWLSSFVDVIIPRTDTPGASDAGVPTFIDRRFAASPAMAENFRTGSKALDEEAQAKFGALFPALTVLQQTGLLTPREKDPFFRMMKGLTIDGYYTSQAGLTQELGWHGNTFLMEFPGCTHIGHQA